MKKVVVGDILIQDNQERRFGADPQYVVVWVIHNGKKIPIVFTEEEFSNAVLRAQQNSEDIPELGSMTSINEFDNE